MKKKIRAGIIIAVLCAFAIAFAVGKHVLENAPESSDAVIDEMTEVSETSGDILDNAGGELDAALDYSMTDAEGNKVYLSDYFGKPIVMNFWATWCDPCKGELPDFQSAYEEYGEDVVFLMVNMTGSESGGMAEVKVFYSENGYTFPIYYDEENLAANTYGVSSVPETYFITADGHIYSEYFGSMDEDTLSSQIETLLNHEGA